MESKNEETGDPKYRRAFTALDELNLASLKPFFKKHVLQDDTLAFMESEEELRKVLTTELDLPFGEAFKFSKHWFKNYQREVPSHVHSEKVTTTSEEREKKVFATPCNLNENSAQTQPENFILDTDFAIIKLQQQGKNDETINSSKNQESRKSNSAECVLVSAPIPSSSGSQQKEKMLESCQPESQAFSQEKAVLDSEDRNDERRNASVVKESSHVKDRHYKINVAHMNISQSGYSGDEDDQSSSLMPACGCREVGTDENVTLFAADETFVEDDQVEQKSHRIQQSEDHACVETRTNPKDALDNNAQDSKDDPISEQEEPLSMSDVKKKEQVTDQREVVPSGNSKTDSNLDTRTEIRGASDCSENQSTSHSAADGCQEQSTQVIVANEENCRSKTLGLVYNLEDEVCIAEQTAPCTGKKKFPSSFPELIGPDKGGSHLSNAKKEVGKKNLNKPKAEIIQSNETIRKHSKEDHTYASLDDKSLESTDFDPCSKEDGNNLEDETISDVLRGDLVSDLNNNAVTIAAHEIAVSVTTEPLATNEERSDVKKEQNGTKASSEKEKESCGTFPDEQVPIEASNQSSGPEKGRHQEVSEVVSKCTPRALGVKRKETAYEKGFVLDAEENKEVEFKSLTSAHPSTLPWKIMEKAKKFICACLNAGSKGIIYFGVGDSQEQCSKFKRGEILGLDVEDVIDDIMKAFQFVLDDHIESDDGPLQKGGEQNCVNLEFIPVVREGNRINLYVIEIEVIRDWKFCKDNVYYCKRWSEKRGVQINKNPSIKKALSDIYKVHKDQFDDVAIRTNGASTNVKQHEVNRQVREPLTAKYKEWKREAKFGVDESPDDPIPDDSDVKRFSALVRERLRDLNFKDFNYVLIANKLPLRYRGTPNLAFLQNIPWLAVFDLFDAASKKDGLQYVCNETTDAPRANLRSLDDFKKVSSDWISGKDCGLSTRGTTWILGNEEMQKGDWIKCSRDCFYRALSSYKLCCPLGRLLCVFLVLDESSVQEMVDMMECCFSILGNAAINCVTILSENNQVTDAFIKASKLQRELRECSITGIPWTLLKEIVREILGPTRFEERGAKTELPYFTGLKQVFNKMIHSWDDLEVYSPNPRLSSLVEDIEKARNSFYKGAQASQTNLFHNHCIPRTLEEETILKIEQALKALSKPSKDISCHVKTVTVTYESGSGATTLCRRILWNKREKYRCAVVKAITPNTDFQIEQLQGIIYDEENFKFAPPCLVLVDNFPENETKHLTEKILKRQTKCVILSTFPIAKLSANFDFDLTLRQLDEKEMSLVKDILINITSDSKRRREAEEVLEREKRFIWFGLELFGRDYDKIEERLLNHIKSTLDFLDDSQEIHERVLNFCCFLHYYSDSRAILPHPVVSDLLYEASNEKKEDCALMQHIHKIFGGLLLEGFNERYGYYGWRPAHSLVSEAVKSRINVEDTAIALLEAIHNGKAYANKFLKEQVFKVFLARKKLSDAKFLEDKGTDDGSIDSDFENEVLGFYEVKTRYSPLIMDMLKGDDGIRRALRLLITICEKAPEYDEKAYAWQQLARFMGYEMRAKEMDAKNEQHHRLHATMNKEQEIKLSMPKTGIEAAHIAVDIAINQQPNNSHHYGTKGTLYLLQLRDFKSEERPTLPALMPEVIEICRKALDVYDKAPNTAHQLNYYSMIGKIQAIVSLLEIVKELPFFRLDGERVTTYLKKADIPREMEDLLSQEEHRYIKGLSTTTLGLLNEVFGDVRFRHMTTYDNNNARLIDAKIRASKLRRTFYEITGFDRSELSDVEVPIPSHPLTTDAQAFYQQFVQDILFKNNETPYSTWVNLTDEEVSMIYNMLKAVCSRDYTGRHDDMLICCKACLRLKERPSVEELDEIVTLWISKYPNSEWAHLFNYMIHFPIPDKRLAAFNNSAKESIKKCNKIVLDKTGKPGFRKSGAEYFLGKGTGLYAIANSQQFPSLETKGETKTDFWRSKEISEKLERVCGQKDANLNGVITYKGIQLRFDDTRYPKQSKDDLWFYIGFSVSGPYAYDPVDNDTYAILSRKTSERFHPFEDANGKNNLGAAVTTKANMCEQKKTVTIAKRGKKSEVANGKKYPYFSYSIPSRQKPSLSSTVPVSPNSLTRRPLHAPQKAENSAVSSSCFNAHVMSAKTSWDSVDGLYQSAASSNRASYAAATLQVESTRQKEQTSKTESREQSSLWHSLCGKGRKGKSVEGTRGKEKQKFHAKYVDKRTGKLHHGARVQNAEKSKECNTHTSEGWDNSITIRCSFAHSWRGDTLQYVCNECTRNNKTICKEKDNHEPFIFNLGPYLNEDGKIWKETRQERPK